MSSRTTRRNRQRRNRRRQITVQRSVANDVLTLNGEGSCVVTWYSGSLSRWYMDVHPGRPNVCTLANAMPTLAGFVPMYTFFRVPRLTLRLVPTIPANVGCLCVMGWDPDRRSEEPKSVNDVVISRHHASCSASNTATLVLNPSSYYPGYNEVVSDPAQPQGVVQVATTYNGGGVKDTVVMYVMVSFTIQFKGLHSMVS